MAAARLRGITPVKRSDARQAAGRRDARLLLTAAAAASAMAAAALAPARGQAVSLPSFVQFNTVCLKCHEAQRSGRLSFDSAADSRSHILRYAGRLTDAELEEMFVMLRYMKEQCGYYPLLGVPGGGRWTAAEASRLRSADQLSYFIPLGALERREYLLRLRFDAEARGAVRITSVSFEELVHEPLRAEHGELLVRLRPLQAAAHYLHLHLDRPATLLELELAAAAVRTP